MISSLGGEPAHRVPFDSPMTDVSGSSSTSSPPLKQRVRQRLQADNSRKQHPLQLAGPPPRPNLPSLNLVTDFTAKSGHKRQESLQERRKKARKEGSKSRIGSIKSVNNRVSGLSPSDRTLVIGIALQPERVDVPRGGLVTHNAGNHVGVTPEIVITPAALENPWNLPDTQYRPRSSVYSQASQYARGVSQFGHVPSDRNAPPVPQLPSNFANIGRSVRPVSAASWHTEFSDGEDRDVLCRRYSGESQLGILRTKSIETPAARRPSRGWWNTLLSPLMDRSNTIARRNFPQGSKEKATDKKLFDLPSSPVLEAGEKRASQDSPRSDITPWEENRNTLAFFNDSPTQTKQHPDWQRKTVALSPDFVPEKGFGEAAEYFEACWHDLHSPTPFFECQNHSCRRLWFYRHGPVIGGPDAAYEEQRRLERSMPVEDPDASKNKDAGVEEATAGAYETSKALDTYPTPQAPKSPHIRNLSDSTDINEEPDAASEWENAQSVPSSKSGSPMPEGSRAIPSESDRRAIPSIRATEARQQEPEPEPVTTEQPRSLSPAPSSPPRREAVAPSPPALTPGLNREFAAQNAIPMQQTKTTRHIAPPPPPNPLQIDEPRAAPLPPQPRSLEPEPTMSSAPSVTPWSPLGNHPVQSRSGLGIDTHRSPPREASPASVTHYPRTFQSERAVSQERSHAPVFAPPPRAWPIADNQPAKDDTKVVREKKQPKDRSAKWTLTGCFSRTKAKDKKEKKDKRRKRLYFLIGGGLLAMVLLIVILVVTLTIPRSDIPIQSSWLNITGFPPIPTGIATVAQPNAAVEFSQCVAPTTMWSCAVPKEQQQSIAPNQPDQPNFRIEIRFQNGSAAINSTASRRSVQPNNAASAGHSIRGRLLQARDQFTNSLFTPNPAPPSQDDQNFLGNTTDNNTAPAAGEATPFFISFLPTTPSTTAKLLKRQDNGTNPFPNISIAIPPPSTNSDGTAAAANLYPFPSAQPLQLYNRGRSDEHYGFYTYFDRSIFLRSQDLLNSTSSPNVPDDEDGGSLESAASARCTWTQTRFLVQIWTNAGSALSLLSASNSTATNSSSTNAASGQSSADDFTRPGSFPYPVSITMDRHGGDIANKMIYCYGMDENERIVSSEKQIHIENRDAGGPGLVNPSQGIFASTNVSTADGGPGGIDGGLGGCRCLWQNWAPS
ncbi:hypothetical protein MMC10_011235 [Thelotrema lepadinum]|nr:hypothetical protein [Thelotrema lepadinum]